MYSLRSITGPLPQGGSLPPRPSDALFKGTVFAELELSWLAFAGLPALAARGPAFAAPTRGGAYLAGHLPVRRMTS